MALKRWFLSCNEMKSRCYFDVLDDFLSQDDLGERREHCCSSVSISCRRCLAGSLFSFVFSGLFLLRLQRALHASTLPSGLSRVNASLQARSNTMQLCTFCVARVLSDTLVLIIIISNVLFLCECFFYYSDTEWGTFVVCKYLMIQDGLIFSTLQTASITINQREPPA